MRLPELENGGWSGIGWFMPVVLEKILNVIEQHQANVLLLDDLFSPLLYEGNYFRVDWRTINSKMPR